MSPFNCHSNIPYHKGHEAQLYLGIVVAPTVSVDGSQYVWQGTSLPVWSKL